MLGLNMDLPLLVSDIVEHAGEWHSETEIVARNMSGAIERSNYRMLRQRSKQLAQALDALNATPDGVLGSLAWSTREHLELFYGISGTGRVLHTINPRLHDSQITYIANHANDEWLFCDDETLPIVERIAVDLPKLQGIIYLGAEPPSSELDLLSYEDLLAEQSGDYAWPSFDERRASTICYTSGTTGNPKGAVYSNRSTILSSLFMSLADSIGGYAAGALEVVMPIAPLFHGNGWQMVYTAPMSGHKIVLPGRNFEPAALLELMQTEGVTVAAAVPTVWLGLVEQAQRSGTGFGALRAALIAGSRPPDSLLEVLQSEFGVYVAQTWGMTEGLGVAKASVSPGTELEHVDEQTQRAKRQGRVNFGTKFKLVDDDGNEIACDGTNVGYLHMRGPVVTGSYLGAEPNDGWLDTGDIAKVHPDGSLELVDRAKDVIKSGGEWISTLQLESAAMQHPEVSLAAAIGVAHPQWQERPMLIVVRTQGSDLTAEALTEFLTVHLASWWVPDEIRFTDELPLTGTGKVNKMMIRKQFDASNDLTS